MEIEKVYEPQRFEPHWAKWWVDEQIFHVEAHPGQPYFSLAIPPPNVTGSLHMGHMFEHSIIDAQIRWRRMTGVYDSGPKPDSEPETRALRRLILKVRPNVSIWYHQHEDLVDYSGGAPGIE